MKTGQGGKESYHRERLPKESKATHSLLLAPRSLFVACTRPPTYLPVWSFPPVAPMISVSRRSLAVWMSSSPVHRWVGGWVDGLVGGLVVGGWMDGWMD